MAHVVTTKKPVPKPRRSLQNSSTHRITDNNGVSANIDDTITAVVEENVYSVVGEHNTRTPPTRLTSEPETPPPSLPPRPTPSLYPRIDLASPPLPPEIPPRPTQPPPLPRDNLRESRQLSTENDYSDYFAPKREEPSSIQDNPQSNPSDPLPIFTSSEPLIPCPDLHIPYRDSWPFSLDPSLPLSVDGRSSDGTLIENLIDFRSEPSSTIYTGSDRPTTISTISITDLPGSPRCSRMDYYSMEHDEQFSNFFDEAEEAENDQNDSSNDETIDGLGTSITRELSIKTTSSTTTTASNCSSNYCAPYEKELPTGHSICFGGWVRVEPLCSSTKISLKSKELYWCQLKDAKMYFYKSDTDLDTKKLTIDCRNIVFIGKTPNAEPGSVYFHMAVSRTAGSKNHTGQNTLMLLQFQIEELDELDTWLMLLAKVLAPVDVTDLITSCDRAGRVLLQEGSCSVNKKLDPGWICMTGRKLSYVSTTHNIDMFEMDMRKSLGIVNSTDSDEDSASGFVILHHGSSLKICSEHPTAVSFWKKALCSNLNVDSNDLEEQRLTSEDVPVLVDKCISFISTHGLEEKGLYRISGNENKVKKLVKEFKKDAVAALVRVEDYSVHDVATCLRRFLRGLSHPIFPVALKESIFTAAKQPDPESKIDQLRSCLGKLPRINYATLRKLLDHLNDVAALEQTNSMSKPNLSSIFGPALFNTDSTITESRGYGDTGQEINTMYELINHTYAICKYSQDEIHRKETVAHQLHRIRQGSLDKKQAGGLLTPIHLFEKENQAFNLAVELTAAEVCEFAVKHKKLDQKYEHILYECVRNGQLERIVFPEETLLDICVKRWQSWSNSKNKQGVDEISGCYFVLKQDLIKPKLEALEPYPFCTVRFAGEGSASFDKRYMSCESGVVKLFKDKLMSKPIKSWNVEDILWYFGREDKRGSPFQHNLTFLPTDQIPSRSKYFGYCLSFEKESELLKWIRAVFSVQRPFYNA